MGYYISGRCFTAGQRRVLEEIQETVRQSNLKTEQKEKKQ